MGPELDGDVAITDQVQVGVVHFLFGKLGHASEEIDGRNEIVGGTSSPGDGPFTDIIMAIQLLLRVIPEWPLRGNAVTDSGSMHLRLHVVVTLAKSD